MHAALLAFAVGLGQGLLHGLGPDHCAAMATLGTTSDGGRRGAFRNAVRFALGHSVVLAGVALFCLLAGAGISETFERWAEIFGGAVLLSLAVAALVFPSILRHGHVHLPEHQRTHTHPPHERSLTVSTAAGALMAVSGARALLLALPPLVVGGAFSLQAWAYLPGFSLGILASMGGFGLLLEQATSRLDGRLFPAVQKSVAVASAVLALWWVGARLGG